MQAPRRSGWDLEFRRPDPVRADRGRDIEHSAVVRRRRRRRRRTSFTASDQSPVSSVPSGWPTVPLSSSKVHQTRKASISGTLDSPQALRLTPADVAGGYLPSGWLLYMRQGTLLARRFNATPGELTGDPITVADNVGLDISNSSSAFSVSRDGIVAYRSIGTGRRQLTWFDRAGKAIGTLGPGDENELVAPSLSPDGRKSGRPSDRAGQYRHLDLRRCPHNPLHVRCRQGPVPIWSPDGRYVAFDSNRTGPAISTRSDRTLPALRCRSWSHLKTKC